MLVIRRAVPADAAALTVVARRTFHDAYAGTTPLSDLEVHMDRAFGPVQQQEELADPGLVTLLAEMEGAPIGFAQVRIDLAHPTPPTVIGAPVEIVRFYIDQAWTGRGVAWKLMAEVLALGRKAGGEVAWLMVWRENARAIRFYEKCGFDHRGEAPYLFADRIEQDWVMVRSLLAEFPVHPASA